MNGMKYQPLLTKQVIFICCLLLVLFSVIFYSNGHFCRICADLPLYANSVSTYCVTSPAIPAVQKSPFQKVPPVTASDVLLLGYMRSGSTFTGEILGIRKNQFYVYEPLHRMATHQYFKSGYVCNIINENCSISTGKQSTVIDIIYKLHKCDQSTFQNEILPWQLLKVNATKLPQCEHKEPLCWSQILKSCRTSSARVSKVLRLTVGLAGRLLFKLPNLKIILLLRDPRAIADSSFRVNKNISHNEIKSLCKKIRQDCKDFERIQRKHPEKIHRIFYEDIATNPMEISKLFDLVGFSSTMDDFLHIHSMIKSKGHEDPWKTARRNSAQTARKWRKNIPWNVVQMVDSECADVYKLLGYPLLKNKDFFDESIPLRIR